MKITILLAFTFAFLASCTTQSAEEEKTSNDPLIVGGDEDEHGCKPSAGYRWSEIRKECIRIFETGIRLNAVDKSLEQSLSAFIVFAADSSVQQIELYIPAEQHSVLLQQKENRSEWHNDGYTVISEEKKYTLLDKQNNVLYESEMP